MKVYILSAALQEIEEASDYYEEQRQGLGHEFIQAYEKALDKIRAFPRAWWGCCCMPRTCRRVLWT